MLIRPKVLLTAHVYYWLPDYEHILQEFTLQEVDELPDLPRLWEFVNFWRTEVEGKLKRVEYAYRMIGNGGIRPARFAEKLH